MTPIHPESSIDFASIFEAVPANYLILLPNPPDFTIVAASDAYVRVTLNDRNNMLNRKLFEVFPDNPDDPEATGVANLAASLHQVILTKRPHKMAIQKYDIPTHYGEGFEERYWSPLNSPVINAAGEIKYIIHHVEDITEKIKTEGQLETQTEKLRRTNEELEQFVRISSHDLKEPLRKMQTFAGLLKSKFSEELNEEAKTYVDKISSAAERMNNRINDLLRYTHLRAEEGFEMVNLQDVFDEALTDLELLINEKHALIKASPLPVIRGIRPQLHLLLYNLLFNALKFNRPGELPIIDVHAEDLEGQKKVEIVMQDNGIGFDQQQAEKIFVLFRQLLPKSEIKGSGIGLSLCKKVALNHGGEIFAIGKPGIGAEFHVVFPIVSGMLY